jgi:hypothetical protein
MQNKFHFTVNQYSPNKTDFFYMYTKDEGCQEFIKLKDYNELVKTHCLFNDGVEINQNNCKIKIII